MRSRKSAIFIVICFFSLLAGLTAAGCTGKPAPAAQPQAVPEAPQPVISSLTADRQVSLMGTTQVICTATEAGTDNLTYNWAATGGTISGAGSTITWTAPDKSGDYMVTVVVSDGTGGATKKNVIINVPEKPNNAPVVDAIKYTRPKRMPVTIKPNMTDEEKKKLPELVAIKYDVVELACQAHDADNDKLDYIWQATGGKLVGTGANVQWIAAGEPGTYTISVEVMDDKGASGTFQIVVSVHCCSG
jgi:ABC-type Fe3+-hydroxamate transport system substrate-binding protein